MGKRLNQIINYKIKRDIPLPAINWKLLGDKYDWGLGYSDEAGNVHEIRLFLDILSI